MLRKGIQRAIKVVKRILMSGLLLSVIMQSPHAYGDLRRVGYTLPTTGPASFLGPSSLDCYEPLEEASLSSRSDNYLQSMILVCGQQLADLPGFVEYAKTTLVIGGVFSVIGVVMVLGLAGIGAAVLFTVFAFLVAFLLIDKLILRGAWGEAKQVTANLKLAKDVLKRRGFRFEFVRLEADDPIVTIKSIDCDTTRSSYNIEFQTRSQVSTAEKANGTGIEKSFVHAVQYADSPSQRPQQLEFSAPYHGRGQYGKQAFLRFDQSANNAMGLIATHIGYYNDYDQNNIRWLDFNEVSTGSDRLFRYGIRHGAYLNNYHSQAIRECSKE